MAVGWSCPNCPAVLAPHVTEHRCDPPSAGVPVGSPRQPNTWPGLVSISAPNVTVTSYPDTWTAHATTGHLSVAGGYLAAVPDTDAMPPRPEITEGAA